MIVAPGAFVCEGVRLTRRLAEGGMGSVWLAEHVRLGVQVAVKLMAPALARDPSALARFTREARLTSRVRSPHVVHIYDCLVPDDDSLPFMVMEHLEGEDLSSRLERGALSLTETAEIVAHVSRALGAAH
jgi:serine/threonine protein kinase